MSSTTQYMSRATRARPEPVGAAGLGQAGARPELHEQKAGGESETQLPFQALALGSPHPSSCRSRRGKGESGKETKRASTYVHIRGAIL